MVKTSSVIACDETTVNEQEAERLNAEIEKGMQDLAAGRIMSAQSVAEKISREYGI